MLHLFLTWIIGPTHSNICFNLPAYLPLFFSSFLPVCTFCLRTFLFFLSVNGLDERGLKDNPRRNKIELKGQGITRSQIFFFEKSIGNTDVTTDVAKGHSQSLIVYCHINNWYERERGRAREREREGPRSELETCYSATLGGIIILSKIIRLSGFYCYDRTVSPGMLVDLNLWKHTDEQ